MVQDAERSVSDDDVVELPVITVCTENDVYDANCGCTGTLIDSDNDGVCDVDVVPWTG